MDLEGKEGRPRGVEKSIRILGVTFRNVHEMNQDKVFSDSFSSSYFNFLVVYICLSFKKNK